ncbi:MAG: cellulase family glycosylhydrolase [Candidatus Hydrogenedentes bacterium]|nr:cellulase family glycosylhydrolase [Candidatus Hydrogenedentota bacterium]
MRLKYLAAFIAAAVSITVAAQEPQMPGLRIGEGGVILKDGKPVRALGVNYMDAFSRCLENPEDTSYRAGFETLAAHDIPFARLQFGGFYAVNWALYQSDPDKYFALMDGVVKAAEETGVGLIPSLFWWTAGVPDLVGEPVGQWGNPESKTQAFMRTYVGQVVSRYVNSPAIWAWEFGNEYSLAADLPNAAQVRPPALPSLGGPESRSAADDLSSEMIRAATIAFAAEIRKIDGARPITTGHSLPRPSAHHQHTELSWGQDSVEEFQGNLVFMTPDPSDLISIHVYPDPQGKRFGEVGVPYGRILNAAHQASRGAGKGLFVGEFGAPPDNETPWTPETAMAEGLRLFEAIEASPVQLAAYWVFDFSWQESSMNVTATNARSGYLNVLREANKRMAEGAGPR